MRIARIEHDGRPRTAIVADDRARRAGLVEEGAIKIGGDPEGVA